MSSPEHLVPAPPNNSKEVYQLLDKCKTPWKLPGHYSVPAYQHAKTVLLCSRGSEAFSKGLVRYHASGGTPWKGKQLPTKRAHSDVIQNFPIIILKIEAIGKNQEVQQKQIRNYTLTKFKPFLKILCSRKKKGKLTGHCRFSCFLGGTNSELLLMAAKTC